MRQFSSLKQASDLISCGKSCFVKGDFNLPKINWSYAVAPDGHSITEVSSASFCDVHKLTQHVDRPTLGSNVLDLVLSTNPQHIFGARNCCPLGTSGHVCISFSIRFPKADQSVVVSRDFKAANYEGIKPFLSRVHWYGSFATVNSVNDMYEMFLAILNHCIDLFVPLKRVKLHHSALPRHLHRLFLLKSKA